MSSIEALVPVPARHVDAHQFAAHFQRHLAESGRGDVPHFSPMASAARSDVVRDAEYGWSLPLGAPGWSRAWLLWDGEERANARVVGHLLLRGPQVESAMHRASLSIGVERPYARQGLGTRLIEVALSYARDEAGLAQLELQVFSTNLPARRLYERLGFRLVGTIPDAYRFDGGALSVDDHWMVLSLRR